MRTKDNSPVSKNDGKQPRIESQSLLPFDFGTDLTKSSTLRKKDILYY